MNTFKQIAVAVLLLPSFAFALGGNKHNDVPAIFGNAKTFFVESADGPLDKPGLNPAEAQAITDIQDSVLRWHRYDLALHREKADLIFVLRKGRPDSSDQQPGLRGGSNPAGQSTTRIPGQSGQPDSLGTTVEAGPEGDSLRVYTLNEKGKLVGPIWTREIPNGLNPPSPLILNQLKTAIDRTFPPPTTTPPPAAIK